MDKTEKIEPLVSIANRCGHCITALPRPSFVTLGLFRTWLSFKLAKCRDTVSTWRGNEAINEGAVGIRRERQILDRSRSDKCMLSLHYKRASRLYFAEQRAMKTSSYVHFLLRPWSMAYAIVVISSNKTRINLPIDLPIYRNCNIFSFFFEKVYN